MIKKLRAFRDKIKNITLVASLAVLGSIGSLILKAKGVSATEISGVVDRANYATDGILDTMLAFFTETTIGKILTIPLILFMIFLVWKIYKRFIK